MTWRTAMTLRLLLFCISHTISAAYTPNNFYPALRGSSLFPPRARSRHWAPKPFAVQPRMDPTPVDAPTPIDSSDFPLLSPKDKRLMGIFRCYGWGPGCSDSSFFAPKHGGPSSSSASSLTSLSQQTRSRDDDEMQQQMVSPSFKTSSTVLQQRTSPSASGKFEPFFTLTSGGSWGPTGRKRDGGGMRRYSVAEKRLDFLKQILRDMLEEIDEDDSGGGGGGGGGHRSLGIRRRTKRSVATYRSTPELYIRPESNFSYGVQQLQRRTAARRQQRKMTVNRYS